PYTTLFRSVIVAQAAADGVGRGRRGRPGRVIRCIDGIRVEAKLIVQGLATAVECQREVFGLTVAAGQRESDIYASVPGLEQPRMERLLVRAVLEVVTERLHPSGGRFYGPAGFCRDLQLVV